MPWRRQLAWRQLGSEVGAEGPSGLGVGDNADLDTFIAAAKVDQKLWSVAAQRWLPSGRTAVSHPSGLTVAVARWDEMQRPPDLPDAAPRRNYLVSPLNAIP